MEIADISSFIDYTLLKADADMRMFEKLCAEAAARNFYSVCVPPCVIKECKDFLKKSKVKITTVAGFPLGFGTSAAKAAEIKDALERGADEVDAVMNVCAFKSGNTAYVGSEFARFRKASEGKVLKIIIETCFLAPQEIALASRLAAENGADFVKTSTGYGTGGAKITDVEIIKSSVPENVRIKASGGIKAYAQAFEFIKAGASRIGSSSLLDK